MASPRPVRNENAGALVPTMARSCNMLQSEAGYSGPRPQADRSMKTSCNVRPDHTNGSFASFLRVHATPVYPPKLTVKADGGTRRVEQFSGVD
jgi:hypothetical protein